MLRTPFQLDLSKIAECRFRPLGGTVDRNAVDTALCISYFYSALWLLYNKIHRTEWIEFLLVRRKGWTKFIPMQSTNSKHVLLCGRRRIFNYPSLLEALQCDINDAVIIKMLIKLISVFYVLFVVFKTKLNRTFSSITCSLNYVSAGKQRQTTRESAEEAMQIN